MADEDHYSGGFGAGSFGAEDFGGVEPTEDSPIPATRPDCGGIYGTSTYGQRYYAGHLQCASEAPATRPDCGGIYGTATFGMRYYAGHRQCGVIPSPPIPPEPDTPRYRAGRSQKKPAKQEDLDDLITIIMMWQGVREIPTSSEASLPRR